MPDRNIYPVCPHRNVAAAFECFFGPDSRSLERYFETRRVQRANHVLRIVRVRGSQGVNGTVRGFKTSGQVLSKGVADLNVALSLGWTVAFYALSALGGAAKFLLYQAYIAIRAAAPRMMGVAVVVKPVLGRWTAHYRRPVMVVSERGRIIPQ
jgi:hypothetical protein